jgi:hypothetical protein
LQINILFSYFYTKIHDYFFSLQIEIWFIWFGHRKKKPSFSLSYQQLLLSPHAFLSHSLCWRVLFTRFNATNERPPRVFSVRFQHSWISSTSLSSRSHSTHPLHWFAMLKAAFNTQNKHHCTWSKASLVALFLAFWIVFLVLLSHFDTLGCLFMMIWIYMNCFCYF